GERRYRASLLAGLDDIPALVRHLDTRQVLEIQVIENLQRRGVNELEEADGYHIMMRDYGYTADDLAAKVGKSKAYIYARLKLASLCEAGRKAFYAGTLSASVALLVARIPTPTLQEQALDDVLTHWNGPMSARAAAAHIQQRYMLRLKDAPFPRDNAFLLLIAGTCTTCPKNTANDRILYADTDADVCTDPACYLDKTANHLAAEIERKHAAGYAVIAGKAAEKLAPHGIHGSTVGAYALLDEKDYYNGNYITARKALGKTPAETVYIVDSRRGRLVEAIDQKALKAALKATGVTETDPPHMREQKDREQAAKAEADYRRALFAATRTAYRREFDGGQNPYLFADDMRLVARRLFMRLWDESRKRVAATWIEPDTKMAGNERQDGLVERIATMTGAELCALLLDCALVDTLHVSSWADNLATPDPLLETAQAYGVDHESIRANLAAAAAAKKTASPPTKAPRGGDSKPVKKSKPVAKAAPAPGSTGKATPKKTKTSGRVTAAGGNETPTDPPAHRCPNTPDMLEGVVT
ncbi:MAG TPA: ParB/RepB/Spo0J family partition protein, partial [Rhodocyclaceae bacterium]|nr:ParB/RepB/Spo0J family partition protein [Rhodocyclaceae bacterium]